MVSPRGAIPLAEKPNAAPELPMRTLSLKLVREALVDLRAPGARKETRYGNPRTNGWAENGAGECRCGEEEDELRTCSLPEIQFA
jgi:hypothetical protein